MSGLCCLGLLSFFFFFLLVVCFFVLVFFWSVTSDEEQADWTLLASAVPSTRLKDDLYSRFQVSPSFVFNITKYKQ